MHCGNPQLSERRKQVLEPTQHLTSEKRRGNGKKKKEDVGGRSSRIATVVMIIMTMLCSALQVDYFDGVQYDISEEKEAEQSFQLRKEALGSCTEGVVISDPSQPDNPIIYCSNSFLRITGYSMDEVIGRNCRFLQGPGTDEDTLNCIREAIAKRTQVGKSFF